MRTLSVIEQLDVSENIGLHLFHCSIFLLVNQLLFQTRKETLCARIVLQATHALVDPVMPFSDSISLYFLLLYRLPLSLRKISPLCFPFNDIALPNALIDNSLSMFFADLIADRFFVKGVILKYE